MRLLWFLFVFGVSEEMKISLRNCDIEQDIDFRITGFKCTFVQGESYVFDGRGNNKEVNTITFDEFDTEAILVVRFVGNLRNIKITHGTKRVCDSFYIPLHVTVTVQEHVCNPFLIVSTIPTTNTNDDALNLKTISMTSTISTTMTPNIRITKTSLNNAPVPSKTVIISPNTPPTATMTSTISMTRIPSNTVQDDDEELPGWAYSLITSLTVSSVSALTFGLIYLYRRKRRGVVHYLLIGIHQILRRITHFLNQLNMGNREPPPQQNNQRLPPQQDNQQLPPQQENQQLPPQQDNQQLPPQQDNQQLPPQQDNQQHVRVLRHSNRVRRPVVRLNL